MATNNNNNNHHPRPSFNPVAQPHANHHRAIPITITYIPPQPAPLIPRPPAPTPARDNDDTDHNFNPQENLRMSQERFRERLHARR